MIASLYQSQFSSGIATTLHLSVQIEFRACNCEANKPRNHRGIRITDGGRLGSGGLVSECGHGVVSLLEFLITRPFESQGARRA